MDTSSRKLKTNDLVPRCLGKLNFDIPAIKVLSNRGHRYQEQGRSTSNGIGGPLDSLVANLVTGSVLAPSGDARSPQQLLAPSSDFRLPLPPLPSCLSSRFLTPSLEVLAHCAAEVGSLGIPKALLLASVWRGGKASQTRKIYFSSLEEERKFQKQHLRKVNLKKSQVVIVQASRYP